MSRIIKLATAVSIPLGILLSVVLGFLTASYTAQTADGSVTEFIWGPDAALSHIETFGLAKWLLGLLPYAIVLSLAIFVGCVIYGYVQARRS